VIVAWLIFLPALVILPLALARQGGTQTFLSAIALGLLAIYLLVPITVTKRYFVGRAQNRQNNRAE
jgi:hypothetical protein